jgi:integrin beta 3
MDLKSFADTIMRHVADYVRPAIDELSKRIDAIPAGKDGINGVDGKNGADGRDGKDGRDGIDGKDGAPGERGEKGEKGERGETGEKGDKGDKGEKGDTGEAGPAGKRGEKGEKGDTGEPGAKGERGEPGPAGERGEKGERGIDGKDGRDGRDGIDGKSVMLEDVRRMWLDMYSKEQAGWALDFERRAQDLLHQFMSRIEKPKDGKDGRDGIDGRDGLGFDDFEVQYDGKRSFTLVFTQADRQKEFTFKVPVLLECGVHKQGATYERGDGVTFQGSYWIAQRETTAKPGEDDSWRLAVKKGRDGKDAERPAGVR